MKKFIQSAELIRYNANSAGRATGDCVKRAISTAFDMPYTEVANILNATMKEKHKDKWNIRPVFEEVINQISNNSAKHHKYESLKEAKMLDDFADQADPNKIYIVLTGKTFGRTDHMVCVRDGKVWDSWDSRDQLVNDWYELDGSSRKAVTDIKQHMSGLAMTTFSDTFDAEVDKYLKKHNMDYKVYDLDYGTKNYQIIGLASICLSKTDWIDKNRYYNFKIVVPLTPTMTVDEAKDFIVKTTKVRTYDKMYAISAEEKKLKEEQEVAKQIGENESANERLYMTDRERRFVNSLPGWIRPLITYVDIQRPGEYSDSYKLWIKPHPGIKTNSTSTRIDFEGYDANMIKSEIDLYKEEGLVPFEDYSPTEMF